MPGRPSRPTSPDPMPPPFARGNPKDETAVPESMHLVPLEVSDRPEDKFREFLAIRGEKLTEQRRALVRHVFSHHKHFDADELIADMTAKGLKVSRATVYRTLPLLVEAGLLRELRLNNRTAYEHDYGYPSHDHLHCTECNAVIEFTNEELRKLSEAVSREHGFQATEHRFLILGVCSKCQRKRTPKRRLDLI